MPHDQPTHHEPSLVIFDDDLSPLERLFELDTDQYAYIKFTTLDHDYDYVADGIVIGPTDAPTEDNSESTISLQGLDGRINTIYIERLAETAVTVTKITSDTPEPELKPFPGPDKYVVDELLSVSAHHNIPQPDEYEMSVRPAP